MIEIYMNDGVMEENVNVQTKTNKNPKNERNEENEDKSLKNACLKKRTRNHMEDYLCVGVFIMSMIMQNLTLKIHKSCVISFVIKNT